MTIVGLTLILVGIIVGLSSPAGFNGQWLLGLLIALVGVVFAYRDRKD